MADAAQLSAIVDTQSTLTDTEHSTTTSAHGQAGTLRLVTAFEARLDRLYGAILEHARGMREWSVFLSRPEAHQWAAVLYGSALVLDRQSADPLGDGWPKLLAESIAHKYARYSHQPAAQRRRAYQRAEAVNQRNQARNAAICRDRASGMTYRALTEKHGVSERTCRRAVKPAPANDRSFAVRSPDRPEVGEGAATTNPGRRRLRAVSEEGNGETVPNTDKGRGVRGGAPPLTATARLVAISHPYQGPSRMIPTGPAGRQVMRAPGVKHGSRHE